MVRGGSRSLFWSIITGGGAWAMFKFVVQWSVPGMALALPLFVLLLVDRRLAAQKPRAL